MQEKVSSHMMIAEDSGLVVIQLMYGYARTVLNQDIGLQETMELLKQNQKLKHL